jgi:uncharacterized membrane protein YfcA
VSEFAPAVLAWCAVSLALAGVVKGAVGIGIPLVGISLLSLALPVPQAVALLPVPIIVANTWQAVASGIFLATCRRFAPLLLAMLAGTLIGGGMLTSVDQSLLMVTLGAVVLAFAALELSQVRLRVPVRHHAVAGAGCGLAGGILGGMSGIFGPPIIVFLVSLDLRKEEFVGTIASIYLASGVILGVTLAGYGVAGTAELLWSAAATLPVAAGMALGQWLRRRTSERVFRTTLLVLLLLVGLNLIRRGLLA